MSRRYTSLTVQVQGASDILQDLASQAIKEALVQPAEALQQEHQRKPLDLLGACNCTHLPAAGQHVPEMPTLAMPVNYATTTRAMLNWRMKVGAQWHMICMHGATVKQVH